MITRSSFILSLISLKTKTALALLIRSKCSPLFGEKTGRRHHVFKQSSVSLCPSSGFAVAFSRSVVLSVFLRIASAVTSHAMKSHTCLNHHDAGSFSFLFLRMPADRSPVSSQNVTALDLRKTSLNSPIVQNSFSENCAFESSRGNMSAKSFKPKRLNRHSSISSLSFESEFFFCVLVRCMWSPRILAVL